MKTSSPSAYQVSGMAVKTGSSIVDNELSKASGKIKARYPDTPLGISQANGEAGKMKIRALTPGTSPAGS